MDKKGMELENFQVVKGFSRFLYSEMMKGAEEHGTSVALCSSASALSCFLVSVCTTEEHLEKVLDGVREASQKAYSIKEIWGIK